jgi:hypothetical protein
MSDAKTIRDNQLLGERGIALITEIVLKMGYVFRATPVLDGGIDGEIELRDRHSGAISNQIIKVQSKAVSKFANETDDQFCFWPSSKDVKYWLGGNVPVIVVVSCPDKCEAYWVSIQAYKNANPTTKGIHFDKAKTRLDSGAADSLASLVKNSLYGKYTPPVSRTETLLSNLLPVTRLPELIYIAETQHRERSKVFEALKTQTTNPVGGEWILKNERIFSLRDLRKFPYAKICEQGTVEEFPVREWTQSTEHDKQRELVQLLNCALREKLYPFSVAFDGRHPHHCYYFRGQQDRKSGTFRYFTGKKQTKREVFKVYERTDGSARYCRHSAFRGQFLAIDGAWHLEVTPSYYFTRDGLELYPFYQDPLKGIKRLERNNAVRGQLIMWIELLTMAPDMHREAYPFLSFGRAAEFAFEYGINDADWLAREQADEALTDDGSQGSLVLV